MESQFEYKRLYSETWIDCDIETANIFIGNPSIKVRQKTMKTLEDYKDKIESIINNISYYKLQSDEMLFLAEEKERELKQVQKEYFDLVDKGFFNHK